MTPVTASSHLPSAPGTSLPASHHCRPAASKGTSLRRRSGQNRSVDRRRSDKLATAIVDPPPTTPASASPTQAAAPSNPHRRQQPARRPAGSFLGGFRTPALRARADSHDGPASETLHQSRRVRVTRSVSCGGGARSLGGPIAGLSPRDAPGEGGNPKEKPTWAVPKRARLLHAEPAVRILFLRRRVCRRVPVINLRVGQA